MVIHLSLLSGALPSLLALAGAQASGQAPAKHKSLESKEISVICPLPNTLGRQKNGIPMKCSKMHHLIGPTGTRTPPQLTHLSPCPQDPVWNAADMSLYRQHNARPPQSALQGLSIFSLETSHVHRKSGKRVKLKPPEQSVSATTSLAAICKSWLSPTMEWQQRNQISGRIQFSALMLQ